MLPYVPTRLVIARHRIDFRKQWDGFLAETYRMGFDPYAGDCVVFIKRDRTQLRALMGDALGLIWVARRFDGGSIKLPWLFDPAHTPQVISLPELTLLLEGATCTIQHQVQSWQRGKKENLHQDKDRL